MSRWQVVDRVRELSTKAVKSGGEGSKCVCVCVRVCVLVLFRISLGKRGMGAKNDLPSLHVICCTISYPCLYSGHQESEVCSRSTVLSNGGSGEVQGGMSEDLRPSE